VFSPEHFRKRGTPIADRVELQKAIDSVPRRQTVVWPSGGFLTSVAQVEALPPFGVYRPPPPQRPAKPAGTEIVPVEPAAAPEASQGLTAASTVTKGHGSGEADPVPVWQALLDVQVQRGGPWWWRLAGVACCETAPLIDITPPSPRGAQKPGDCGLPDVPHSEIRRRRLHREK
jgi:hypothetical protein